MLIKIDKRKKLFKNLIKEKKIKEYLDLLKKHHKETYLHSLRVGLLSVCLGYKNSLLKKQIKLLGYSGVLHDLGKLNISKKILSNGSKLNGYEKKIIKEHPRFGFIKLKNFEWMDVKKIIIKSHEHTKDSYPRKKRDQRKIKRFGKERREKNIEIDKLGQIVAIADMYDALAHKRAYKKALDNEKISKILKKEFKGDKIYIEQILNIRK